MIHYVDYNTKSGYFNRKYDYFKQNSELKKKGVEV